MNPFQAGIIPNTASLASAPTRTNGTGGAAPASGPANAPAITLLIAIGILVAIRVIYELAE